MAPNDSAETNEATGTVVGRRKAARYIVPFAVAGVAAATIGLVPALANSGDPDLPDITAQELIEKIAASDEQQLSGTVKVTTDLGIPSLGGLAGSFAPDAGSAGSSADPESKLMELASGTHTLRVAVDGPDKQRLSILGESSEYSLVHNGDDVWGYDSGSNEVYHAESDGNERAGGKADKAPEGVPGTPKELAEKALAAADDTTSVTVDGTAQVAGRDAYRLVIKPKQSGSTIGSVTVAVDASTGVPLKFTLAPSGGGKAAVDAGFTQVDFAKPDASSFSFTPPKGAEVTEADEIEAEAEKNGTADKAQKDLSALEDFQGLNVIGKGWSAVAEIDLPGGAGLPAQGSGDVPAQAQQFLDALGDKVTGDFGSGTVFRTRLVNALLTDDGKVYVGAVTKDALVKAADTAE
ncbi:MULTISPECIES: outer membrane lipoprotein carrier protein LolA [Streptomyces]|uniref:Outer membrane lipoprotein carrier protein LolA n=1 Tax=Streptomyces glycanivorans TaxID=3033808 RepID=A0ABY9JDP7_9ACTN|nr:MULTISPECIES: outer membrane lipoprotein carrier protein LolA [unclassified Streptomyces]WSQ78179.1 outer membrane lipoprotein carrier protein LolA [Streptomyces sp. NBC_01213]TXS17485.1 outer membrane lipoprotein carrier protein LolA [Streptomyces sp. wa22]WLQ64796.1 outer membrane lipoprotein carrier protein LolA [Streptomyces sp. Alt3]WSQ85551.1 outer membrane lipoprotein carrier protein LolA [Streptomyces sp. NBC_01212]WSR08358.1 outer membrane lipoprotein carrier protein LolA [Streptom